MVNGEARHDGVECAELLRQRLFEVMRDDADVGTGCEARPQTIEHDRRKIERDSFCRSASLEHTPEQPAVTAPEIKYARGPRRYPFEQRRFTLGAVRYRICPIE